MNEWENRLAGWWVKHRGRTLGLLAGLVLAWIILRIGWGAALTIAVFLYLGYSFGGSFDPE